MGKVHMILQGKGGVGKSVIATLLAQRFLAAGRRPLCIDTDPVNATFASYPVFDARRFHLLAGEEVDRQRFDDLLEALGKLKDESAIIDSGASTFVPFSSYLTRYEVGNVLANLGHEMVVHTVVTGGKPLYDTAQGLMSLAQSYTSKRIVVWLNPHFGPVEKDGREFEDWKVYRDYHKQITAVVRLPVLDDLTSEDLETMFVRNQVFEQAIHDGSLLIMQRQRLRIIQRQMFEAIDRAGIN